MSPAPLVSLMLGVIAATTGGWAFTLAGIPLGWILGAMAGSALFGNTVGISGKTRNIRRTGQLLVGTATAGVLTPDILSLMFDLLPAMIAAAIAANAFGFLLAWPLAAIAGTDRLTALLSALPAGMAEMSSLAREVGARAEIVTVIHTLRVILVVLLVPFILNVPATFPTLPAVGGGSYLALGGCLLAGWALALLASRIGLLNPFIIMPMVLGVAFVAAGVQIARMPGPALIAAQIFIGFSLGARLKREDFRRLPRAAAAGTVCGLILICAMAFIVAPLLELWTATDIATLTLGVAPGGLGEMIASAKALGAASAIVAGFQFVRSFLTNMIVPQIIVRLTRGGAPKGGNNENR